MICADDIAEFFSRPIAFHRALVGGGNGVTGALLLSQAIYWQRVKDRDEPGQWFYKTTDDWREETGMTRDEFQTARRRLVEAKILEYALRGVPAKGHYRVNFEVLASSLQESRNLACGKAANLAAGNPPSSSRETRNLKRTETSSENTQEKARAARRSSLPEGFGISNGVREWARSNGWEPYLAAHLEHFLSSVAANGRKYVDWDAAFRTYIQGDYGDVRRKAASGKGIALPPTPASCGNCGGSLDGGHTRAEKGNVCNPCWRGYINGGWPAQRADRRTEGAPA